MDDTNAESREELDGELTTYWQLYDGFRVVHCRTDKLALTALSGKNVTHPLADGLFALELLVNACSDELGSCRLLAIVDLPPGKRLSPVWAEDPEVCHIRGAGQTWEIGFAEILEEPDRAAFGTLPAKTKLEARWAPLMEDENGGCRFAGTLAASGWRIESTHPALTFEELDAAVELACTGLRGDPISAGHADERGVRYASNRIQSWKIRTAQETVCHSVRFVSDHGRVSAARADSLFVPIPFLAVRQSHRLELAK